MADGVEVEVIRLDVSVDVVRDCEGQLSSEERQRAARFAFERDRRRFAVTRARLRQLLAARLNIGSDTVELSYLANGKPVLAARKHANLRFNVSHCDEVAVFAFATGREVGIDVERIRWIPDIREIATRFFSRRENEALQSVGPQEVPEAFFNCWTRKEAFIKALGAGLSYPLDRFDVSLAPGQPARILRVGKTPGARCGWQLRSFSPAPGFVGAVASQT